LNAVLNSIAILLALFAAYNVAMNCGCVSVSYRNRRRGIDRYYSAVPIVPQLFLILADVVFSAAPSRWIARSWLISIALADISLWMLIIMPFVLLFRRL
jgi:hypothetical protein